MSEYRESIKVDASPLEVFEFVSDPTHMSDYLSTVHFAEHQGPNRVRVKGSAQGREYDSDAWFRVNENEMRMEWGSDGENKYSGWLEVLPDSNSCIVTTVLMFEPWPDQEERFQQHIEGRNNAIRDGLHRALQSVKSICEGESERAKTSLDQDRGFMG